ncbi:MAG: hypothetical protein KA408_02925 [Flavobacteriales bacterium]|nr:hypothetical protein [Flavobacteriales bacterium]
MKHLSKFLPAETLLMLEDDKADLKELLKTTFMDLLLKQVIEITTISKQSSSSRDKVRYYKYVIRGKNFLKYRPLEHEIVYLSPYQKSSSIKILFQHLIRMGFQNSKSESKYISAVRQSTNINHYFTKNIFQTVFGGFSITQDGLELRNKIKTEIAQLEKELPPIITSDKEKALQILNTIGGNIFILKNIDFSLLKQIDSEILAEMNRKYKDDDGGGGCYGCSSWDSGCTGCSSSGCSGCSGCGGGCGGD